MEFQERRHAITDRYPDGCVLIVYLADIAYERIFPWFIYDFAPVAFRFFFNSNREYGKVLPRGRDAFLCVAFVVQGALTAQ